MNTASIDRRPGSYNLCNPSDKSYQVYFTLREELNGRQRFGFLVDEDHGDLFSGCETALDYAECLIQYGTGRAGRTWLLEPSWLPQVREIEAYLQKWDVRDRIEMYESRRAKLTENLEKVTKKLERLYAERQEEIEEEQTPSVTEGV